MIAGDGYGPFIIESGIPAPRSLSCRRMTPALALVRRLQHLRKGESVWLDLDQPAAVYAARNAFGHGNYVTRAARFEGKHGIRVWRIGR